MAAAAAAAVRADAAPDAGGVGGQGGASTGDAPMESSDGEDSDDADEAEFLEKQNAADDAFLCQYVIHPFKLEPISTLYVPHDPSRNVRLGHVKNLRNSKNFMSMKCEVKPLVAGKADPADPNYTNEKRLVVVNGLHRYTAKTEGLTLEQQRECYVAVQLITKAGEPDRVLPLPEVLKLGNLLNKTDSLIAPSNEADRWYRAVQAVRLVVPPLLAAEPNVPQTTMQKKVLEELDGELQSLKNDQARVKLAVMWIKFPQACAGLTRLLAHQKSEGDDKKGKGKNARLLNLEALDNATVRSWAGLPEQWADQWLAWALTTAYLWTGYRGDRSHCYRLKNVARTTFWRVLMGAMQHVVAMAVAGQVAAAAETAPSQPVAEQEKDKAAADKRQASAEAAALRALVGKKDTTPLQAPVLIRADAADGTRLAVPQTIATTLRQLVRKHLNVQHDDPSTSEAVEVFTSSAEYAEWCTLVQRVLHPTAPQTAASASGGAADAQPPKTPKGSGRHKTGGGGSAAGKGARRSRSGGGGPSKAGGPAPQPKPSEEEQRRAAEAAAVGDRTDGAASTGGTSGPRNQDASPAAGTVWREEVGPARARVLMYEDLRVGPPDSDSDALFRLTEEARLDTPVKENVAPCWTALLPDAHEARRTFTNDVWDAAWGEWHAVAMGAAPYPPPAVTCGAGAEACTDALRGVLLASQTWVLAQAAVDTQGWYVFGEDTLPDMVHGAIQPLLGWSRTEEGTAMWVPSYERPQRGQQRASDRQAAVRMRTAAGSKLILQLRATGDDLKSNLALLDVCAVVLAHSIFGASLDSGQQLAETGGRLRWNRTRVGGALQPYYDGIVTDNAADGPDAGKPLLPRCLVVVLTGSGAVELDVVRGSHVHLRSRDRPWDVMRGPFERVRVPRYSAMVYDAYLVRRVPETSEHVDVIWYEAPLYPAQWHQNSVFVTLPPGTPQAATDS